MQFGWHCCHGIQEGQHANIYNPHDITSRLDVGKTGTTPYAMKFANGMNLRQTPTPQGETEFWKVLTEPQRADLYPGKLKTDRWNASHT